ncbi:trypsin-like peptidase domain-containing protein [Halomontanus rarus]|uniref:trypsin-like peptidase domain-containing protein n=1 Tax=Halomontanus rarus TaxID=3034020 RepID=UPI001A98EE63
MGSPINSLYAKSTLITYRNTSDDYDLDSNGTATGFFYKHDDEAYLVTNEHVVRDNDWEPIDAFDIHISPSEQINETERCTVDLLENGSEKWHGHSEADIAVIPVDLDFDEIGNLPYTKRDILPRNASANGRMVSGGDSAIAIGFPQGFTGSNKLPVIRSALISTPYGVPFNREPCFLTDAQMHPGMSGSPVLTEKQLTSVNFSEDSLDPDTEPEITSRMAPASRRYLLGIHSEQVAPIIERDDDDLQELREAADDDLQEVIDRISNLELLFESKIDLNKVWYADIIHHILSD